MTDALQTAYAEAIKGRTLNPDAVLSFDRQSFDVEGTVDTEALKSWVAEHSTEIAAPPSNRAADVRSRIIDRRTKAAERIAEGRNEERAKQSLATGSDAYRRRHPEKAAAGSTEPAKGTAAAGASAYARRHRTTEPKE